MMDGAVHRRIRGRRGVAIRTAIKRREPLCVKCKQRGIVEVATEVDHIIPLDKGGGNEASNMMPLCHQCHVEKSARDQGRRPRHRPCDINGMPLDGDW
jgi:5-methylcytosine-specific restriction protein A